MNKDIIWELVEIGILGYKTISKQAFENGIASNNPNVCYFQNKVLNNTNMQYVEVYTGDFTHADMMLKLQIEQSKKQDILLNIQAEQNWWLKSIRWMLRFFTLITVISLIGTVIVVASTIK